MRAASSSRRISAALRLRLSTRIGRSRAASPAALPMEAALSRDVNLRLAECHSGERSAGFASRRPTPTSELRRAVSDDVPGAHGTPPFGGTSVAAPSVALVAIGVSAVFAIQSSGTPTGAGAAAGRGGSAIVVDTVRSTGVSSPAALCAASWIVVAQPLAVSGSPADGAWAAAAMLLSIPAGRATTQASDGPAMLFTAQWCTRFRARAGRRQRRRLYAQAWGQGPRCARRTAAAQDDVRACV